MARKPNTLAFNNIFQSKLPSPTWNFLYLQISHQYLPQIKDPNDATLGKIDTMFLHPSTMVLSCFKHPWKLQHACYTGKLFQNYITAGTSTKHTRIYPSSTNLCRNPGTSLHIWWNCPSLTKFLTMLSKFLLSLSPHGTIGSGHGYLALVLSHSNLPRIHSHSPSHCQKLESPPLPSSLELKAILNNHCLMEYMYAKTTNSYLPKALGPLTQIP